MSVISFVNQTGLLAEVLANDSRSLPDVIGWAAPVLSFGDPGRSTVATLGLNPSNLEYLDDRGAQLIPPNHRLESLTTLGLRNWRQLDQAKLERIWQSCANYFERNPYGRWFNRLERILSQAGFSYYGAGRALACHLDLAPFATAQKWSSVCASQRVRLLEIGAPSLAATLKASSVRVVILNGSAVVSSLSKLTSDSLLSSRIVRGWSLQGGKVAGRAFCGRISKMGGVDLGRELLVLGFNHNIQSSFGVTSEVISSISHWLAGQTAEFES